MSINLATKQKVTPKTKPEVVKPKAKKKRVLDPKEFKGTYKYDRDARIQICVPKNPKREGSGGYKRFELYKSGMRIRDFLKAGGKTIDLDWDRERGFIATEDKDKSGSASKSEKSTFTLK
jgi:cobalamin biosynthesis protein CbiG|tara:strand:- start:12 stop:371 length:360 start_codon:yes stop_codon:yes gene_type:complete